MFTKEDFIPAAAERWLFILAPGAFMFVALMTSAVIPWGTQLTLFGNPVDLQVADINIGILYIMFHIAGGVWHYDRRMGIEQQMVVVRRSEICSADDKL